MMASGIRQSQIRQRLGRDRQLKQLLTILRFYNFPYDFPTV